MNGIDREILRRGGRVHIRHPVKSDCEEFLSLSRASRALHHPWVYPPIRAIDYLRLLERLQAPNNKGFLVCLRQEDAICGMINLSEIVRGAFQSAYMGYYIGLPHANHGYMTEGIDLVLGHAFREMKLHRIEANIQPENIHSIALVRGCGFQKEGISPRYLKIGGRWRDHERWAILREEWSALKKKEGR